MKSYWRMFREDVAANLSMEMRARYGNLSSIIGIMANSLLFAVKFTLGSLNGSVAVVADAFNNLSDMISQLVTFISFKLGAKPADKEHPYGHARIEYIATSIVATLILLMGFNLLKSSWAKILNPSLPESSILSLAILLAAILLKFWLYRYNMKLGRKISSELLIATAKDSLSDVLATTAVLLSSLIALLFKVSIDAYVGLLVALFVLKAGIEIMSNTMRRLLGTGPDPELYQQITDFVEAFDDVLSTHDLIVHEYGPKNYFATVHVTLSEDKSLRAGHEIADRIEREIMGKMHIALLVHVDPEELHDQATLQLKNEMIQELKKLDPSISLHDFRLQKEAGEDLLLFDILLPLEHKGDGKELEAALLQKLKEKHPQLQVLITVDRMFVPTSELP